MHKFGPLVAQFAHSSLLNDLEFDLYAVEMKCVNFKILPPSVRAQRHIVSAAIVQDGDAIIWASDAAKAEKDLMLLAVANSRTRK